MNSLFDGIQIEGIVRPGEVYILTENEKRGCMCDPLDFIYSIRSDPEILLALEMEITLASPDMEFSEFRGYERISGDCHVFRFLCLEKPEMEQEEIVCFYLQRIMNLREMLAR